MIEIKYNYLEKNYKTYSLSKEFLILNNSRVFYHNVEEGSRYQGFFVPFGNSMLKLIHKITPKTESQFKTITNMANKIIVERQTSNEEFFIPEKFSSLVYKTDSPATKVILDIKQIFDNRTFGRYYNISCQNNKTIIHFEKKTSNADGDLSNEEWEYECFLVINCKTKLEQQWQNFEYNFDKARNSPPPDRYMMVLGDIESNNIVFTYNKVLKKALEENDYVIKNQKMLEQESIKSVFLFKKSVSNDNRLDIAYCFSRFYLSKLCTDSGIIAGLPWFFQPWTRDELISIKSAIGIKGIKYAKILMFDLIKNLSFDGRLPSIKDSDFYCIDSIGWLFRLAYYFLTEYKSNLSKKEMIALHKSLQSFGDQLIENHAKDGMISNKAKETWMDSLGREGFRIEIQALFENILEVMKLITKDTKYLQLQLEVYGNIRKSFFDGNILYDGRDDKTVRNNIFLAYYLDKRILKSEEWQIVFHNSLQKLWLEWGGIATIDKTSSLFVQNHTGENPSSYHNGDSWFFMNHIAAISMLRLNKKMFEPYIKKIINASVESMLSLGCLGSLSELSSAGELRSEGCPLQAWSIATFIEMIELAKNEKFL